MGYTLTVKGQVTVPKRVREYLGLKPGAEVEFEVADDGLVVLKPVANARGGARTTSRFTRFRGRAGRGLSTEDYMRLVRGYDEDVRDPGFR